MTLKAIDRQIALLKNKIARATTRPDPHGTIIDGLRQEIARLQVLRTEVK